MPDHYEDTSASRPARGVRPTWMEVDLDALTANYEAVRAMLPRETEVIASVKANGYGHGVVGIVRHLADLGVRTFATGCFDDVLALRAAGVDAKVLLFAGHTAQATKDVMLDGVVPTICNLQTARAVSDAAESATAVFVKVDCGLGRFGVGLDHAFEFICAVAALPRIVVEGMYTHLPFTDSDGRDWAARQVARFATLRDELADAGIDIPVTQAVATAGLLAGLDERGCTAVCLGHILYGLSPVSEEVSGTAQFQPVLRSIRTEVVHLAHHACARPAGMSGKSSYPAGSTTGVVPLGLIDGYPPPRDGRAQMLVRGRRVPVLSTSLESSTLDLTGAPTVSLGDPVFALGEDGDERITLRDLARWQGTRELHVLMELSGRMPVTYVRAPVSTRAPANSGAETAISEDHGTGQQVAH